MSALQPARLIDLAEATGIPEPTVRRLLKQFTTGRSGAHVQQDLRKPQV